MTPEPTPGDRPAITGDGRFPRPPWTGKNVVLGVCGGIAAYKIIQVARDLTLMGCSVRVILTEAAQRFVTPLSFEGVTGRAPVTDMFSAEGAALHVSLGREADCVCVAPATADFLSRAAGGRADDLLSTTLLATKAPVVLAPAMNDNMFSHPQTVRNLEHLRDVLGYQVVGPVSGKLAVGEGKGPGRLVDPGHIVEAVGKALTPDGPLTGKTVFITAGPTREPVDAVRYVGNRSSGRMGFALARAAWRRGADVQVVAGPVSVPLPHGVTVTSVETAEEMLAAASTHSPNADVSVFSAAVADFRPTDPSGQKIKKEGDGGLALTMEQTPDVAKQTLALRKEGGVRVGFALESQDLEENARAKLESKGFDLVVANPANEPGAGFGTDTNRVSLLSLEGEVQRLPLMSKDEVADAVLDRVEEFLS